ncbi:MAG: prolipoprotein diacylglyceryl transferase [Verrucomicrobia bacterium]|nr:prolipoprotein diacylglyceryl transferase [Verrucomicrobiota bacterium]MBI3869602.1 prolipoprotein diacylglyceryl transferase [Verrucomicrobiota bacterium]
MTDNSISSNTVYGGLLILAIVLSALFWMRQARHEPRLMGVFIAALAGAFLGAKALYILIEGRGDWSEPDRWARLASGKTVIGALLGGFIGVECAKRAMSYTRVTGDLFASVVPASVALGRIGCWRAGCCLGRVCDAGPWALVDQQGTPRWPAVPMEFVFNLLALAAFWLMRRRQLLTGQHFHLYLIAYGCFRIAHEPLRATPKWESGLSGYQFAAALLVLVGTLAFWKRAHETPRAHA